MIHATHITEKDALIKMILKGKTMFASLHTSTLAVSRVQSRGTLASLATRIRLAMIAHHQRAQLAKLDDALLADIGVTAREAATEANRAAWDVPRNWLR